jgi:argininosuccinate synthase
LSSKVVLAYSGGLDTSVSIKWLQEKYGFDVVTLTLDLGQKDDFKEIEEKAYSLGAVKHCLVDAKDEFVQKYIYPSIRVNGLYEDKYPLSTALGRPLIASKLVEVAWREEAKNVAHGCTGKGNDQVRIEVTVKALDPGLRVVAPVREWNMNREEEMAYAKKHGLKLNYNKSIYSVDQNIWGRSIESGVLEDPSVEPPAEVFDWVTPPEKAPDKVGYLDIEFLEGVPVTINDKKMDPVDTIEYTNAFVGMHGVGIVDHIEDRVVGIKSREVYECPAAMVLVEAHRELEKLVLTKEELDFKALLENKWAWLVYSGLWQEPLRRDIECFVNSTQERVTGHVRVKLYKGGMRIVGRSSPYSLYNSAMSTYLKESSFDQDSAVGFIEIWGLQSRLANEIMYKAKNNESRCEGKTAQKIW